MPKLKPQTPAPTLQVPLLSGSTWTLADQTPEAFTMIVFYRGLHCPICKGYLRDLDRQVADFKQKGVSTVVISADPLDRAQSTQESWELQNLEIGYNLTHQQMTEWDLYMSKAIKAEETPLFCEPGLILVKPDNTLYYIALNSMPFGRPSFKEMLGSVGFVLENNYPARGEV